MDCKKCFYSSFYVFDRLNPILWIHLTFSEPNNYIFYWFHKSKKNVIVKKPKILWFSLCSPFLIVSISSPTWKSDPCCPLKINFIGCILLIEWYKFSLRELHHWVKNRSFKTQKKMKRPEEKNFKTKKRTISRFHTFAYMKFSNQKNRSTFLLYPLNFKIKGLLWLWGVSAYVLSFNSPVIMIYSMLFRGCLEAKCGTHSYPKLAFFWIFLYNSRNF